MELANVVLLGAEVSGHSISTNKEGIVNGAIISVKLDQGQKSIIVFEDFITARFGKVTRKTIPEGFLERIAQEGIKILQEE